jgi:hypothetical protein
MDACIHTMVTRSDSAERWVCLAEVNRVSVRSSAISFMSFPSAAVFLGCGALLEAPPRAAAGCKLKRVEPVLTVVPARPEHKKRTSSGDSYAWLVRSTIS